MLETLIQKDRQYTNGRGMVCEVLLVSKDRRVQYKILASKSALHRPGMISTSSLQAFALWAKQEVPKIEKEYKFTIDEEVFTTLRLEKPVETPEVKEKVKEEVVVKENVEEKKVKLRTFYVDEKGKISKEKPRKVIDRIRAKNIGDARSIYEKTLITNEEKPENIKPVESSIDDGLSVLPGRKPARPLSIPNLKKLEPVKEEVKLEPEGRLRTFYVDGDGKVVKVKPEVIVKKIRAKTLSEARLQYQK